MEKELAVVAAASEPELSVAKRSKKEKKAKVLLECLLCGGSSKDSMPLCFPADLSTKCCLQNEM